MHVFWKVQGIPKRFGAGRTADKALKKLPSTTGFAREKIVDGGFGVTVYYNVNFPKKVLRHQLEVMLRSEFWDDAIRVTEETQ